MVLNYKCRKCIFHGYGINGQFEYQLWDPDRIQWSKVVMSFLMRIKCIEVRKVVFKDIVAFINVKQRNSIDVDSSTYAQPCMPKIMILSTTMCRMMMLNKIMLRMVMIIMMFPCTTLWFSGSGIIE